MFKVSGEVMGQGQWRGIFKVSGELMGQGQWRGDDQEVSGEVKGARSLERCSVARSRDKISDVDIFKVSREIIFKLSLEVICYVSGEIVFKVRVEVMW
jgi:hypothetical protein